MKILLLDIETAPNAAYCWGLWKENIGVNQIINSGYVLSWAAREYGNGGIEWRSCYHSTPKRMLGRIHTLLDTADVVVHYNGMSFDIPTLNKEFVIHGFKPPAPYKQVDLLNIVREQFRFPSNKLDYVVKTLGLGEKVRHPGFELWVRCMNNDPVAWKLMERYNKQDVALLERLYDRLKPWIRNHPNHSAHSGVPCCTNCGSENFFRNGWAFTQLLKYPRYRCNDCGKYFRGNKTASLRRSERFVAV
jgi:DNA polymerase elongation subunit (family B)/DNA-directed RNA polymerase subunit RPC12/RpoP